MTQQALSTLAALKAACAKAVADGLTLQEKAPHWFSDKAIDLSAPRQYGPGEYKDAHCDRLRDRVVKAVNAFRAASEPCMRAVDAALTSYVEGLKAKAKAERAAALKAKASLALARREWGKAFEGARARLAALKALGSELLAAWKARSLACLAKGVGAAAAAAKALLVQVRGADKATERAEGICSALGDQYGAACRRLARAEQVLSFVNA